MVIKESEVEEKKPLVSIIVRTKDRPKLLKNALKSIASQTYRPIEVVLVNDGGCELDIEEIKSILGDVTLNYIRLEKNTGRAHAGNVGIELYPEHVSILVEYLEVHDFCIAYTDSLMVYKKEDEPTKVRKELVFSQDFDYDKLIFGNYIPFMCLMFDMEVLSTSGGFDTSLELYEDWDLLIRIGENYPFYHLKVITAEYNQWCSVSQIAQINKNYNLLKRSYLKVISKHLDKFNENTIYKYVSEHIYSLKERDNYIKNLESIIKDKDTHISKKEIDIENLKDLLKVKNSYIQSIEQRINEKESYIQLIHQSHGWKLLEKYYRTRDRLLPLDTKRRKWAKLFFKLLFIPVKVNIKKIPEYLKQYGIKGFFKKVKDKIGNDKITQIYEEITPETSTLVDLGDSEIIKNTDATISVVIPTKNAGEGFDRLLSMVKRQKGFNDIEIVVVDSGSTDFTLEVAREYGTKIIEIPSENFTHSYSRNLGAENASGEYLFFTVQDALLPSETFFYELYGVLRKNNLAAVSCAEFPREGADLFYRIITWIHYHKFLGVGKKDRIFSSPCTEDYIHMRRNAQLSNIACLIPKETFMRYKYRYGYAEDIDLGIRLIKDGYRLAMLSSVKIIHSHNRSPYYYLKRGYVDNLFLSDIFPDYHVPVIRIERLFKDIINVYVRINELVNKDLPQTTVDDLFVVVKHALATPVENKFITFNNRFMDRDFTCFLETIYTQCHGAGMKQHSLRNLFNQAMLDYVNVIFEYLGNTFERIDDYIIEDFKSCICKAFAFQCGTQMAFAYLSSNHSTKEKFRDINIELCRGV